MQTFTGQFNLNENFFHIYGQSSYYVETIY